MVVNPAFYAITMDHVNQDDGIAKWFGMKREGRVEFIQITGSGETFVLTICFFTLQINYCHGSEEESVTISS